MTGQPGRAGAMHLSEVWFSGQHGLLRFGTGETREHHVLRSHVTANLALVERWIAGHRGLLNWVRPEGGVVSLPRLW